MPWCKRPAAANHVPAPASIGSGILNRERDRIEQTLFERLLVNPAGGANRIAAGGRIHRLIAVAEVIATTSTTA